MNLRLKDVMSLRAPSTSKVYSHSSNIAAASPSCHLPFRRTQGEKSHHSCKEGACSKGTGQRN